MGCGDCHVVKNAESHSPVWCGVMTGRTQQRIGDSSSAAENVLGRGQQLVGGGLDLLLEELLRNLDVNAGPVAGLAVGVDRADRQGDTDRGPREELAPLSAPGGSRLGIKSSLRRSGGSEGDAAR